MKKLGLFVFSLIAFSFFGVIGVNAETITVMDLNQYQNAIKNEESNVSKIVLGGNLDISSLTDDIINVTNNMELDLNGYTITIGASNVELKYFGDYTFTITDSSESNTGTIYSTSYRSHPIFVYTNNYNHNPTLLLEKITITAVEKVDAMIYFLPINEGYKYNVEITGVKFANAELLFSHYPSTYPMLDLNIKSAKGTSISRINRYGNNYKVSDIIDSAKSELVVNSNTIVDPNTLLADYNVITGFEVRAKDGFEVSDITFDDEQFGYSNSSLKPISIKTVGRSIKQVKSVTVNETSKFTVIGSTTPTIAVGNTDNNSFAIKPVDGLSVGIHTATITVIDMQDNSYTASVTFEVKKADIAPAVSIDGWTYEDSANTPSVTGNTGNGDVNYEYKVRDASNDTYSTTVPENAGYYTIRAIIASTDNYNGKEVTSNFTISKKVVAFTSTIIENQVFDNTDEIKQATYIFRAPNVTFASSSMYIKEGSSKYVGTQTGICEFTLSDETFKNYTFAEGKTVLLEDEFEITPVPSTLTIKSNVTNPEIAKTKNLDLSSLIDLSNEYTSNITYTATDLKDGVTLTDSTLSASNEAVANQVSRVTAKFTGADLNNDGILEYSASSDLTIDTRVVNKLPQTLNENLNDAEAEYGTNYSNPASIATGDGTLSYSSSDSTVASINATTGEITTHKVGTTIISITASETENYARTIFTYDLEVTPKPLTVTTGTFKITKEFDGETTIGTKSGTFLVTEIINDDNVSVTVTPQVYLESNVHDENQNLSLLLTGEDKDNYLLETTSLSVPCKITKKSIIPTIIVASGSLYDNSAQTPNVTVKDGETTLAPSEYNLIYSNNIDAGTANVKVTAKSTSNYNFDETTTTFMIGKSAYLGEQLILTKKVLSNTIADYIILLNDISKLLPTSFKDVSIENVTVSSTEELVSAYNYDDEATEFSFTTRGELAETTSDINVIISSKNYNNYTFIVRAKAVDKELITIGGLIYTSRAYNNVPIEPTGTLTHTGYTEKIDVLYEGTNGTIYSSVNAPKNAGKYKVTYSIPNENADYSGSKVYTFEIYKATPTYTIPDELTGIVGNYLSTVELPDGFDWFTGGTEITAGTKNYAGWYSPTDTANYESGISVSIPVYGKNKYDVNTSVVGGNGAITPYSNVVEGGNKEIIFTPADGYMIDTVKVNDEQVIVTSNTYTISNIMEHKNIVVTYKKIPFTITVNEVTGATITPNGTINVLYGDNKEIIITSNLGYRITSVKVNSEEKLPLTENKITINNITEDQEVVVIVEKIEYDVIDGDGQKHTVGKNEDAVFRIDADKDLFLKVYLNDEELNSEFYTITEGSTIITLKKEFLNNLLPGTYSLKATFSDGGSANTTFAVVQPIETNPKTGDPIILSIIIGSISLIGLLGAKFLLKKRNA